MREAMKINDVLHIIQKTLKAPKGQYNSFGKYNYRSCEDIVEAVKELLPEGYSLLLSDEMVAIGNRVYVKAEARLRNAEESVLVYGWARESETRKGMDDAQITGATSSYARKYALNGLFAIDDTKDSDTDEFKSQQDKPVKTKQVAPVAVEKPTTPEGMRDWFIKKLATIQDEAALIEFQNNQKIKDARDKLFNLSQELSGKVEEAIEKKKLEVLKIKSPSEL